MNESKLIYKKIASVMGEVGAIGKDRRNEGQRYNFRGIDDVYNAAHPLFVKHGIFSVPRVLKNERSERTTDKGSVLLYSIVEMEYTFFAEDGSSVIASAVGEGMDSGDKATNKAMSAAHKYAIIQLLSIPTEEFKDSEYENPRVAASKPQAATAPRAEEDVPDFRPPSKASSGYVAQESDLCPQCKNRMMVSKYANKITGAFDFYCGKCKRAVPRIEQGAK
jgi:hypothetical protein